MSQQVRVGAGGGAGQEQLPQVTYSQEVSPDSSQRIPLQQQHLQMSQQSQGGWQAGGDGWRRAETGVSVLTSICNGSSSNHGNLVGLPADVVVGQVQASQRPQEAQLLRDHLDLVVSEFHNRDGCQGGQLFWTQLLDLIVPKINVLHTDGRRHTTNIW